MDESQSQPDAHQLIKEVVIESSTNGTNSSKDNEQKEDHGAEDNSSDNHTDASNNMNSKSALKRTATEMDNSDEDLQPTQIFSEAGDEPDHTIRNGKKLKATDTTQESESEPGQELDPDPDQGQVQNQERDKEQEQERELNTVDSEKTNGNSNVDSNRVEQEQHPSQAGEEHPSREETEPQKRLDDLDESEHNKAIQGVLEKLVSINNDGEKGEGVNDSNHVDDDDDVHIAYDSTNIPDPHLDALEVEVTSQNSKDLADQPEADKDTATATATRNTRRVARPSRPSNIIFLDSPPPITKKRVGPKSRMLSATKPRSTFKKKTNDDDYVVEDNENNNEGDTRPLSPREFRSQRTRRKVTQDNDEEGQDARYDGDRDEDDDCDDDDDDDGRAKQKRAPAEFVVEKVLGKRVGIDQFGNERIEYKIKWDGYPTSANTWEPLCNLGDCDDAIKEYEETQALMLSKKKLSMAAATRQTPRRNHDDSDDSSSSTPQKKIPKKVAPAKTPVSKGKVNEAEVEVSEIIGLSKCGREKYFLTKFHESSNRDPQFLRSSVAAKLIPLKVIDFYTKHLVWK